MQFLHHALFNGPMLNAFYYILDFVTLLVFSTAGFATAAPIRWLTTITGCTRKLPRFRGRTNIDSPLKLGMNCLPSGTAFLAQSMVGSALGLRPEPAQKLGVII